MFPSLVRVSSVLLLSASALAQTAQLTVETNKPLHPVSPTLYGLMTEEINHSYEGGLYAELLRNHSFHREWDGYESWNLQLDGDARATLSADKTTGPSAALPESPKLSIEHADARNRVALTNSGWWGIPAPAHAVYSGSLYAKSADAGPITLRLIADDTAQTLAETTVTPAGDAWHKYSFTLHVAHGSANARNHFELSVAHPGTLWLQVVSLMRPTYANRANGNRIDLMEKMAGLHPTFLRMPGGNYLEGDKIGDRFPWKQTLGPLVDRPGHQAPWSYWSSDGLGLLEFLDWTEDLHIDPVLAVYAGYSLKGEHIEPGEKLQPFINDALDEIEYVLGDASTKWGAQRVKDGHPAPFPLHYVEIGNEDWLDKSGSYAQRYPPFAKAIHARYPLLKLIATEPVKGETPDVIDDHYYKTPGEMFAMTDKYDQTPRDGSKIFVGEWATRSGAVTPNFGDALGDAAWMTGMERNSDVIVMAAYAPMLVNINPGGMQWATDLIGFDAMGSFGSPSYYAQALFAAHLGDTVPASILSGAGPRFFYSATVSSKDHVLHLKLVNANDQPQALQLHLDQAASTHKPASRITLHAASFAAANSIDRPNAIAPVTSPLKIAGRDVALTVAPLTIEVLDVPLMP